jgi:SPP1 family predicted phage head-tail adaptor
MPDLPLTAGELLSMRHTADTYLVGTAILYALTYASDGQGGQVDTRTASGTVAARLAPISGREETVADRVSEVAHWVLTVPANTTLAETGRVTYNGRDYEVDRIISRTPEEITRRAVVVEVR